MRTNVRWTLAGVFLMPVPHPAMGWGKDGHKNLGYIASSLICATCAWERTRTFLLRAASAWSAPRKRGRPCLAQTFQRAT